MDGVFALLRENGVMKKKILALVKALKEIRINLKNTKQKYQLVRGNLEKHAQKKKLYRAVKGDLVDEMFADYINKLNCPVPIARLGNN